ncbi:MAG: class I SAM-dependent methyltransferase [Chloroflexi bacterium]|nr:MAG: class I SAM-dependent methyltransferase [Chloroflexota bacterium]
MAHNWQDPAFAEAWDARHLSGNPARAEHLSLLLAILEQVESGWILDLGTGSGLVARMLLDQKPQARVFGLDSSTAMLGIAKDRLEQYGDRVRLAEGDLTALDRVDAPAGCSAAIAVQSLHHLEEAPYRAAVRWTFDHLAPGGWFFIIDRLAVPEWLQGNGDRPLPVQGILRLLEEAGFQSAALDVRGDRGMLIGRRPA